MINDRYDMNKVFSVGDIIRDLDFGDVLIIINMMYEDGEPIACELLDLEKPSRYRHIPYISLLCDYENLTC